MANEMLTSGGIQVGWGQQWETLAGAINEYYGGGVDGLQYQKVVNMLNSGNYTMEEMDAILGNIPEFNRTYNSAGQLVRVEYTAGATNTATSAAGSVAQQVNSNVANTTTTKFSTVQNVTKDAQTGKVTISDNVIKYKTGQLAPTTMKSIPASAIGAVCAVSTGIKLGKAFDAWLYSRDPDFWDDIGMRELNPETWSNITSDYDGAGGALFNYIFGIDPQTNNPTPYIDQNAFAYMVAYMVSQGVFDIGGESWNGVEPTGWLIDTPVYRGNETFTGTVSGVDYVYYSVGGFLRESTGERRYVGVHVDSGGSDIKITSGDDSRGVLGLITSTTPFTSHRTIFNADGTAAGGSGSYAAVSYTYDNKTVYYDNAGWTGSQGLDSYNTNPSNFDSDAKLKQLAWLVQYGIFTGGGGVEGITDQEGATQFDASGISDPSDINAVLAALMAQFPELWENRIEFSPDGNNTFTYIPVGFPTGGTGNQPTSDGALQSDQYIDITGDGDNSTDELIKTLIDMLQHPQTSTGMESDTDTPTKPLDPNGGDTGTGSTPIIIPPIGTASALWKIYNPSQGQLDTFGAWLWSSNFVDQLLKLFNDPMQAIIGLHKIYATPPTSGSGAIKVGYLVSDASANYVSAQYTEIDCGTVSLKEHFNNVFDYDPFTKISIFLPFIGFRQLNISDVMRGDISVKYGVDVLTGACLAKISVKRDLNDNVLYTFSGNCAVQYPISSGSYVGIITGLLGIAGGIAGTIASGGALAPMLMGAGASIGAMHANVEHSGNISSNAGAMGSKKPYIIIERPQTKLPLLGVNIEGKPQNETVVLGSLTGRVRVKAAEFNGFSCTAGELTKIKQLLTSGIVI